MSGGAHFLHDPGLARTRYRTSVPGPLTAQRLLQRPHHKIAERTTLSLRQSPQTPLKILREPDAPVSHRVPHGTTRWDNKTGHYAYKAGIPSEQAARTRQGVAGRKQRQSAAGQAGRTCIGSRQVTHHPTRTTMRCFP